MKCLLIIDVQNGFVSAETSHVTDRIIKIMDSFKDGIIIATKFINVEGSPYRNILNWNKLSSSPEIDLLDEISNKANYIVEKNIYSGCVDKINSIIEAREIREVHIVGIDTDCCVLKTAIDLFERGIRPIVLTQYCASNGGEESHQAAIKVLERTIGKKQIVSLWEPNI